MQGGKGTLLGAGVKAGCWNGVEEEKWKGTGREKH